MAKARVRKLFAVAGAMTADRDLMTPFGCPPASFLARGQGSSQLTDLTGRTAVWGPLLALPA